jgi:O-antigen/teichoic acid export membrane protein
VSAESSAEPIPAAGLRGKVARGLGWKMLTQLVGQGTSTAVAIVLAHLLTPADIGLAGMALTFTGLAGLFTDFALGTALVQRATITEEDRSTVFWTTMAAGLACTIAGIALAPAVGSFFGTSAVVPLFAVLSLGFVLSAFGVTQTALLTREMDFRRLELRQIAATIVAAIVALVLAVRGVGAWAIIAQQVTAAAVGSLLVWRLSPWRPTRTFSRASVRSLGSFGVQTQFSRILGYLNLYADNLLIGRYLGSRQLGIYTVAYNVMYLPLARITIPIQQVLFAAFARLQDDPPRLGLAWLRGSRLVSAIAVPAFLGIAVVAPQFVPVVLGARWHEVVPVLQLLSVAGVAQTYQTLNWSVIQARGKPGLLLWFMIFSTAVTVGAFVIGLQWGVVGVAASYAIARWIVLVGNTWVTSHVTTLSPLLFVRRHADLAGIALVMAAAVYGVRVALAGAVPQALLLVLLSALGALIYFGLVAWLARDVIVDIRETWSSRRAAA